MIDTIEFQHSRSEENMNNLILFPTVHESLKTFLLLLFCCCCCCCYCCSCSCSCCCCCCCCCCCSPSQSRIIESPNQFDGDLITFLPGIYRAKSITFMYMYINLVSIGLYCCQFAHLDSTSALPCLQLLSSGPAIYQNSEKI